MIGLALSLASACLLRPNELVVIFIMLTAYMVFLLAKKQTIISFIIVAYISLGLVIAWCSVNYLFNDRWSLTNMKGMTFSFTVYNLFDKVHDDDRLIGDIMQKWYLKTNQNGQIHKDYLWYAARDIRTASDKMPKMHGLWDIDIDDYLGEVSKRLALENPGQYLLNVLDSVMWALTFEFRSIHPQIIYEPATVDEKSVVRSPTLQSFLKVVADGQIVFLKIASYLSCLTPLTVFLLWRKEKMSENLIVLTSLFAMCVSTLMVYSLFAAYYPRYSVPFMAIMLMMAAVNFNVLVDAALTMHQKLKHRLPN